MKKVLFITHLTGFLSPGNGGQLRTHHILKKLSQHTIVDLFAPGFDNAIHSDPRWLSLNLNLNVTPHWLRRMMRLKSIRGMSRAYVVLQSIAQILSRLFQSSAMPDHADFIAWVWLDRFIRQDDSYDIIILDTLSYYPRYSWKKKGRAVWLNAHNVEHILSPENSRVKTIENTLGVNIDGVIACTPEDQIRFESCNSSDLKTVCWPNGTTLPERTTLVRRMPNTLIFVGTLSYPPNIEGLKWYFTNIHEQIMAKDLSTKLHIVGRDPEATFLSYLERQTNVTVFPDAPDLSSHYLHSTVSIVPLLSGSGSRLKIPESLIHGCTVVSTKIGAEGAIDPVPPGLILADRPDEFAQAVLSSLQNPIDIEIIRNHAESHFTWDRCIDLKKITQ
jgi:glycosyltransferase involved in cell wall biosynthesis